MGPAARAALAARRASSAFASAPPAARSPPDRRARPRGSPPPRFSPSRAHRPRLWILRAARRPRRSHPRPHRLPLPPRPGGLRTRARRALTPDSPPSGSPPSRSSSPTTPARWLPTSSEHTATSHPDQPLRVYELGGGTGTCAANFLAHVRDAAPDVYARMSYVSVEVSRVLADAQRRAVREVVRDVPETSTRPRPARPRVEPPPNHRTEWRCATRRIARDGARWTARRVSSSRWRCSITFRTIASRGGRRRVDANPRRRRRRRRAFRVPRTPHRSADSTRHGTLRH